MTARRLRAELFRVRTRRLTWLLAALAVVSAGLAVASNFSGAGRMGAPPLGAGSFVDAVRGVPAAVVGALVLVTAVLGTAGDFHHRTISNVLLATPGRVRVALAKVAAYAVVALAFVVLAAAAAAVVAAVWLAAEGVAIEVSWEPLLRRLGGVGGMAVAFAALGAGVGTLVANQTAAVAIVTVWVMGLETLVIAILSNFGVKGLDGIEPWLPGSVARVVARAASQGTDLPLWGAAALLATYAGLLAGAGTWRLARRDIT